jgi:hypothetical protein
VATSSTNPLAATVGAVPFGPATTPTPSAGTPVSIIGVVADGTAVQANIVAGGGPLPNLLQFSNTSSNTSTTPGGYSGTLTFSAVQTVALASQVQANNAPSVLRPSIIPTPLGNQTAVNMPATTLGIGANGTLRMIEQVLQAVTNLRLNAVAPMSNGLYDCHLDAQQMQGLFVDPNFQNMFRGAYPSKEYRQGEIFSLAGVRFIPNNVAPQQTLGNLAIRRALVVGRGALIEGDFKGQDTHDTKNPLAEFTKVDGVTHVTRAAMDRLQQIIAQSWYYIGGFAVPTDITTTQSTIPTANSAYYKRAVVLESV